MRYSDFDNRSYARGSDFAEPFTAPVKEMRIEEMPRSKDHKLVMYLEGFKYGIVLSAQVNRDAFVEITGSQDPMDAVGVTVTVYCDLSVRNPQTGEPGSIRIRAADKPKLKRKIPAALMPQHAKQPPEENGLFA
jgi:hypothetical protein